MIRSSSHGSRLPGVVSSTNVLSSGPTSPYLLPGFRRTSLVRSQSLARIFARTSGSRILRIRSAIGSEPTKSR